MRSVVDTRTTLIEMIGQEIKKVEGIITVYKAVLKRQIE